MGHIQHSKENVDVENLPKMNRFWCVLYGLVDDDGLTKVWLCHLLWRHSAEWMLLIANGVRVYIYEKASQQSHHILLTSAKHEHTQILIHSWKPTDGVLCTYENLHTRIKHIQHIDISSTWEREWVFFSVISCVAVYTICNTATQWDKLWFSAMCMNILGFCPKHAHWHTHTHTSKLCQTHMRNTWILVRTKRNSQRSQCTEHIRLSHSFIWAACVILRWDYLH